jgi:hypothetical protein
MMCHKIGRPPISTIGFGLRVVSSEIRVPSPPARMTAFTNRVRLLLKATGFLANQFGLQSAVRIAPRLSPSGRQAILRNPNQITAIIGLSEFTPEPLKVLPAYKPHSESDFLGTAHPETLAFFQGSHEFRSIEH